MKHLKIKIYTTTKSQFFKDEFDLIADTLKQTRGIEKVTFDVETIYPPRNVPTIRDSDGDTRIVWDWFDTKFVDPARDEYNAVAFHFTPYYKNKWGLSDRINASYHRDSDDILNFWFSCYDEEADDYDLMESTRLILHELRHGFTHWTSVLDNTHHQDYKLKNIHKSFDTLSFWNWNILMQIKTLLTNFLKLYGHPYTKKTNTK